MPRGRSSDPPPLEIRKFTPDQAEWATKLLEARVEEVTALDPNKIAYNDEKVRVAERKIRGTIAEVFGENSQEFRDHQYYEIRGPGRRVVRSSYFDDDRDHDAKEQGYFANGISRTVTMLQSLMETVRERTISPRPERGGTAEKRTPDAKIGDAVFVVHGRKDGPRETVARFIERLRLKPIILHEQANEGRTIIEKFEGHSDVAYAVVLVTGDDRGGLAEADPATYQLRARQNVILELGYFMGTLKRRHMCVLYEEGVEMPSDYAGVVYVPLDAKGAWRLKLAQEMKAAGLTVDMNLAV